MDLEQELKDTHTALKDLFSLVENGYLVRDTKNDDEPGWAMRQLGPVRILARAKEIIDGRN